MPNLSIDIRAAAPQTAGPTTPQAIRMREQLTVNAVNALSALTKAPIGHVEFVVNGNEVADGITNSGLVVTVDAGALTYNIGPTDVVYAEYDALP